MILIAALAPIFAFPPLGRPMFFLVLLIPLAWIVEAAGGIDPIPRSPLNGSLALMAIMVLVSLAATFDLMFSAPKVLGVVLGMVGFFAIVRAVDRPGALCLALDLFVLAGAGLATIGLLGTQWIDKMAVLQKVTAHLPALIRGVPGQREGFQPNAVAGGLVMFIPLQFALTIAAGTGAKMRIVRRLAYAVLLLFTTSVLLLTQSRSGYVSLAVGIAAWMVWHSPKSRWVLAAVVIVAASIVVPLRGRILPAVSGSIGSGVAEDVGGRLELWSRAIYAIEDFPITGMGMNTFRRVMPVMYPTFLSSPDVDIAHAHNHLLQAALDLGIPGLIAYLGLWFGIAGMLIQTYHATADRRLRILTSGVAAGMISYFVFGTADTIALGAKVGIFFWIALAIIAALHGIVTNARAKAS